MTVTFALEAEKFSFENHPLHGVEVSMETSVHGGNIVNLCLGEAIFCPPVERIEILTKIGLPNLCLLEVAFTFSLNSVGTPLAKFGQVL